MFNSFTHSNYMLLFVLSVKCILQISSDLPPQDAVQKIPKIFHTVWLNFGKGDEPFPKFVENIEKLKQMHPDWEIKDWRECDVENLIKTEYPQYYNTYASYQPKIKKHDFSRVAILHKYGGMYLDHDSIALRNVEPLLKEFDVVLTSECKDKFCPINGIMATVPGHKFFEIYLESMCRPGVAGSYVLDATGPRRLESVIREYVMKYTSAGLKLYSSEFFTPVHWSDKKTGKGLSIDELREKFPSCYLFQEYLASWH